MYVMFTYLFVFAMVSLIETAGTDPAGSLKPQKLSPRSHWNRGIRTLRTIILNILANTKPYAKRL
jgi:hypothetical protein